ncbi:IS4 family transposase [Sulfitobacter sp. 915]|uniref:IS4 family transposase n=1 Tax=Sulfitobacter sp. 915 TaxID=3368558 RepID=UPI0037454311
MLPPISDVTHITLVVARLGGHLDRTSDAPPGATVIWRGLSRLADLTEGVRIAEAPETYG